MYQGQEEKDNNSQDAKNENPTIATNYPAEDDTAQIIANLDAMSLTRTTLSAEVRYNRHKRKRENALGCDPTYRKHREQVSTFFFIHEGVLIPPEELTFSVGINKESKIALKREKACASKKGLFGATAKIEHAPGDSPPASPVSDITELLRDFKQLKSTF